MTTVAPQRSTFLTRHGLLVVVVAFAILFPFFVGLLDGQSPAAVIASEGGNSKFLMGLAIEVFILALFALSYDLLLGITGILSFGHQMFFAVGAYGAGIMLKSLGWSLGATLVVVVVLGVLQAILFGILLPRVQGIAFALVTLGIASVFWIVIQSPELGRWTGADVGLQGASSHVPEWINTNDNRFRFYLLVLVVLVLFYVIYQRIVASPTGSVMVAIRENESRALMLGYNAFWFQLFALTVSSITAAIAGMLWTMQQPIITPAIAGLGWMVAVLLMVIIGGLGTLSGAIVGAAVFRLLSFYLERWFGGSAALVLGVVYVAIVLFLPYGIVGTWRARSIQRQQGLERLKSLVTRKGSGSTADS
jgi:branched-chain amino acid transport system permease protein